MMENAWLIPILPLISTLIWLLLGKGLKGNGAYVGIALTFAAFIYSVRVLLDLLESPHYIVEVDWLSIGEIQLRVGFEINPLNAVMLVMISLVSFLVHVYSKTYMQGKHRISVYYAYLSFMTFAMLGLVMAPNLFQLYFFWELVGVGDFFLISFYFYKKETWEAAKRGFMMTRVGNVGLLIGIMLLFWQTNSFEYSVIFDVISNGTISDGKLMLISVLLFIGAIGKSGPFPLHSWIPDAILGSKFASAFIHAATWSVAGVYLVAAMYPLFLATETAIMMVIFTGIFLAYLMYQRGAISGTSLRMEKSSLYKIAVRIYESFSLIYVKVFSLIVYSMGGLLVLVASIRKAVNRLQSGQVQDYGVVVVLGLAVILVIFSWTGGLIR